MFHPQVTTLQALLKHTIPGNLYILKQTNTKRFKILFSYLYSLKKFGKTNVNFWIVKFKKLPFCNSLTQFYGYFPKIL